MDSAIVGFLEIALSSGSLGSKKFTCGSNWNSSALLVSLNPFESHPGSKEIFAFRSCVSTNSASNSVRSFGSMKYPETCRKSPGSIRSRIRFQSGFSEYEFWCPRLARKSLSPSVRTRTTVNPVGSFSTLKNCSQGMKVG